MRNNFINKFKLFKLINKKHYTFLEYGFYYCSSLNMYFILDDCQAEFLEKQLTETLEKIL